MSSQPRVKCICIIKKNGSILVAEAYDKVKRETSYTPLGGGVKFGEYGREAAEREINEEIGAKVADVRFVGTLENVFTFDGVRRHEIVLTYEARFVDPSFYERALIEGVEDSLEHGGSFKATWEPLSRFVAGDAILYPEGLLSLINEPQNEFRQPED